MDGRCGADIVEGAVVLDVRSRDGAAQRGGDGVELARGEIDPARQILVPLGCVVIGFLAFYLFRVIPPVPLSIPFIGVYRHVERTEAGYRLSHERPSWRIWHNGDQEFLAQPGDKIYVFFRVFSPARFSDQVQMRWHCKDPARGWTLHDSIPIRIVGGREQGFRGYGVKSNYQPGEWKGRSRPPTGARSAGCTSTSPSRPKPRAAC